MSFLDISSHVEALLNSYGTTHDSQSSKPDSILPVTLLRQSSMICFISNIDFLASPILLFNVRAFHKEVEDSQEILLPISVLPFYFPR